MTIDLLKYMLAIRNTGSMNKAAKNLYISQPALSRAVKEVENETGILMFQRTNKGMIPTRDGKAFLDKAEHLVGEFDRFEGEYFTVNEYSSNSLLVATQRCAPVINTMVAYYMQQCRTEEYVNLAILEETTEHIISLVCSGTYQIGVLHYSSDQEDHFFHKLKAQGLEYEVLDRSPICAQVNAAHALADCKQIRAEQLTPFPHITYSDEDITGIHYCSDITQFNTNHLKKRIVIRDRGTLLKLIRETDGYYIGCDFSRFAYEELKDIRYLPLSDVEFTLNTLWIRNSGHELNRREERFISMLKKSFSN